MTKCLLKSQSFHLDLLVAVLNDVSDHLGIDLTRDIETVTDRSQKEGYAFLCGRLAEFGKNILRCIELGTYQPCVGFKHPRARRPLPAFLQGLVDVIFDENGLVKDNQEAVAKALGAVLQITRLLSKLELPYTPDQNNRVLGAFCESNAAMADVSPSVMNDPFLLKVLDNARVTISELCSGADFMDIYPKHGPGAVQEKVRDFAKYDFVFDRDLDATYPYDIYFSYYRWEGGCGHIVPIMWSKDKATGNACCQGVFFNPANATRICLVPKDYRGPRVIGAEPRRKQFLQQGLGRYLMDLIQAHPLTSGCVNFADQSINQRKARLASEYCEMATLDMKEASNRIAVLLLDWIFPVELARCLLATRTPSAEMPDGRIVPLHMFAGMGSACCFPVESLVFFALCKGVIEAYGSYRKGCLYVYGDDIIVDTAYVGAITFVLDQLGMIVNVDKSYSRSFYRESCGLEAYAGIEITPVKVKKLHPVRMDGRVSPKDLVAYCDKANELYDKGYTRAAWFMYNNLVSVWPNRHRKMRQRLRLLQEGWVDDGSVAFKFTKTNGSNLRWNKDLQKLECQTTRIIKLGDNVDDPKEKGVFEQLIKKPDPLADSEIQSPGKVVRLLGNHDLKPKPLDSRWLPQDARPDIGCAISRIEFGPQTRVALTTSWADHGPA